MTDTESQPSGGGGRVLALAVVLAVVGGAAGWYFATRDRTQPTAPARAEPAFQNLGADASYVGSDACRTCHGDEHQAHGATPHGRSLRALEAGKEIAAALPGRLDHGPSGLSYRFASGDGAVRATAALPLDAGGEEPMGDHVLTHAFGSGEHVQCFLAEPDGFLVQAPIALDAQGRWAMAPGYDAPLHEHFGRPVGRSCLHCHGGRAVTRDDSLHRIAFEETAIGCERCHGPGSLHVTHHEKLALAGDAPSATPEPDLTIVNPAHLGQARSVEVCTQCHVDEGMTIQRTGRDVLDYRPGQQLADYRITFRPRTPTGEVPTVGHGEQLRASKCFQASPQMDCSTCHDAHARPTPAKRAAHYAAKCATCHGDDGCRLDAAARRQTEGGDDCTTCHMPRADAHVPHGTFTHHRVGIHLPGEDGPLAVGEQLEMVLLEAQDVAERPPGEVERDLALAYLRLPAWRPAGRTRPGPWLSRPVLAGARKGAERGLKKAESLGGLDADGKVALAMLIARTDTAKATALLRSVLDGTEPLRDETRVYARGLLARALFEPGKAPQARPVVEELTRMRRWHEDWELVLLLERMTEDRDAIVRAIQKIIEMRPHVESTHFLAAENFSLLGHEERAAHHNAIAEQMARHLTDERQKAERRRGPPK